MIKGIDLPLHAPTEDYRLVVDFIKRDPFSLGALVTTHKLDLFKACKDMFDFVDPYAEILCELSSLSKNNGVFCAHAKDPISSGLAIETFIAPYFWAEHFGEVLILGAGGSALAMSLYLCRNEADGNITNRITIANRNKPRLESAKISLADCTKKTKLRFIHSPAPEDNDCLVAALPPYSLVVNATGLGKDAPGSPTTDRVKYPENSFVWEINYRGELVFMKQALAQAASKNLHVEDGWNYFIYGWTQVIQEVFHVTIDAEQLAELSLIANRSL